MGNLDPDRQMLEQFVILMFKKTKQDAFVSLRLFPDKGSRNSAPLCTESIRLSDKEFYNITMIRFEQAANWFEPAVFCPPVCTFQTHKNAKTDNLCEGPTLSVECD